MAKLYVFDLDGTLADTASDLAIAVQKALRDMGLPPPTADEVANRIGHGAKNLVEVSLRAALGREPSSEAVQTALDMFLHAYEAHPARHTQAYPGVRELLRGLPHIQKVVLTNKPEKPAKAILDALDLSAYFLDVVGGDSGHGLKPDPQGLQHLMRKFSASPQETLFIGDGPQDSAVAEAAGIPFLAYLGGFGLANSGYAANSAFSFTSFFELDAWLALHGKDPLHDIPAL